MRYNRRWTSPTLLTENIVDADGFIRKRDYIQCMNEWSEQRQLLGMVLMPEQCIGVTHKFFVDYDYNKDLDIENTQWDIFTNNDKVWADIEAQQEKSYNDAMDKQSQIKKLLFDYRFDESQLPSVLIEMIMQFRGEPPKLMGVHHSGLSKCWGISKRLHYIGCIKCSIWCFNPMWHCSQVTSQMIMDHEKQHSHSTAYWLKINKTLCYHDALSDYSSLTDDSDSSCMNCGFDWNFAPATEHSPRLVYSSSSESDDSCDSDVSSDNKK